VVDVGPKEGVELIPASSTQKPDDYPLYAVHPSQAMQKEHYSKEE
jgi:hypothetical protein